MKYRSRRSGVIVTKFALLLIPLLGMVAFCVDVGRLTVTKSELQNAADAAAAAGACQLLDNFGDYQGTKQSKSASLAAKAKRKATDFAVKFGNFNSAGDARSVKLLNDDIEVGFTDAKGNFSATATGYPNTVRVLARRDKQANEPLRLFFAPVIGVKNGSLETRSAATIFTGLITSFDPKGGGESHNETFTAGDYENWGEGYESSGEGFNCRLLPVAFDVYQWMNFTNTGLSPDGQIHHGPGGTPHIQVYPSPKLAPGNFGLLCIGPQHNGTPTYREWILNSSSSDDLQYLLDSGKLPVSMESPKAWNCSPGLHNTLRSEFAAIKGQPRLLPLFKPASIAPYQGATGNGSNATYDIVGFAGVEVTQVTGNGSSLSISVSPTSVIDPTAVFDPSTLYPAGAAPSTQLKTFTHIAPKIRPK